MRLGSNLRLTCILLYHSYNYNSFASLLKYALDVLHVEFHTPTALFVSSGHAWCSNKGNQYDTEEHISPLRNIVSTLSKILLSAPRKMDFMSVVSYACTHRY